MSDVTLIPLSYLVSVGGPVLTALVSAIVWLAKEKSRVEGERSADLKAALEAKDRAEQGRLDDMRASHQVVRETQERVIPVVERAVIELRLINERRARRHADPDSDPPRPSAIPDDLEDTLTQMRRAEEDAARAREKLAQSLSIPRGGTSKGGAP